MANKRQTKKASLKPIRIDKPTTTEYKRLIKNTKSKVTRTLKNHNIDLTEYAGIRPLESFQTRKEFNEWKSEQQRFTHKGTEEFQFLKNKHGISAPKSMIKRIAKNTTLAQEVADKMITGTENLPFHSNLKPTGETVKDRRAMERKPTTAGISRPLDFNFDNITSVRQLMDKDENMAKKASGEYYDVRLERLKVNFMEHLEESFNSDSNELVQLIKTLPPDDFYEMYLMFDEFSFELYYVNEDMDENTKDDYITIMKEYIKAYQKGEINFDLKGF